MNGLYETNIDDDDDDPNLNETNINSRFSRVCSIQFVPSTIIISFLWICAKLQLLAYASADALAVAIALLGDIRFELFNICLGNHLFYKFERLNFNHKWRVIQLHRLLR